MAKATVNMAQAVKARLLNISRKEGRGFDVLLVRFALERLLYRLSVLAYRDRFVLMGGMLVTLWVADENRATRDVDSLSMEILIPTVWSSISERSWRLRATMVLSSISLR